MCTCTNMYMYVLYFQPEHLFMKKYQVLLFMINYAYMYVCLYYDRHWQKLSEELGMNIQPKATFTFSKCLEMGLDSHVDTIAKVADIAGKEFSIEQVSYYNTLLYRSTARGEG